MTTSLMMRYNARPYCMADRAAIVKFYAFKLDELKSLIHLGSQSRSSFIPGEMSFSIGSSLDT